MDSYPEVAGRLRISRARVSQIAGMVLLPVTVQEAILVGEVAVGQRELRKKLSDFRRRRHERTGKITITTNFLRVIATIGSSMPVKVHPSLRSPYRDFSPL